jgi:hypothetical protein
MRVYRGINQRFETYDIVYQPTIRDEVVVPVAAVHTLANRPVEQVDAVNVIRVIAADGTETELGTGDVLYDSVTATAAGEVNINTVTGELTFGTARHGWFDFVPTDGGSSTAIWHQRPNLGAAARFDVFIGRYNILGGRMGDPVPLLPRMPGDDFDVMNAVLAPRPVSLLTNLKSRRREFGVAWQHRNTPADPWEIRFSRLDQSAAVRANPALPTPANPNVSNMQAVFPGMTDAAADVMDFKLI